MIGDRVRALREQRGWTQSHLADASGVSARTIQRVESKHAYSGETAMALAAALGVDVANLVAPGPTAPGEHRPLWPAPSPQAAAVIAMILAAPGAVMLIAVLLNNAGVTSGPMAALAPWLALLPKPWSLWIPMLILPTAGAVLLLAALVRIYGTVENRSVAVTGIELRWHPLAAAALLLSVLIVLPVAANFVGDMIARAAHAPLD